MGLFQSFDICASGMTAQRFRMDTIAENIANVNTTRTEDGEPYRRKIVTFEEKTLRPSFADTLADSTTTFQGDGVKVASVTEDYETDFVMQYDPSHPDADENGYVLMPNVNSSEEQVDLMAATRAYEANLTALNVVKTMAMKALEIGK